MSKFTLTALLLAASLGFAQDRGTIRGTVADPSGAAVPGATVTVKNVDTGLTQTAKTCDDGVYSVLYLPAGDYKITTEKAGFRRAEVSGVRVNVATVTSVDVGLTVGAIEQAVEVTASAPLLDVQGTNLGKVLPTRAIKDLPLFIGGGIRAKSRLRGSDAGRNRRDRESPHRRRIARWTERTTGRIGV